MANVPSTPDIYFRTVQLTCFILSFCLSDSRRKSQGYTIPTEKDLFPWSISDSLAELVIDNRKDHFTKTHKPVNVESETYNQTASQPRV
jgi:hypothetical protein